MKGYERHHQKYSLYLKAMKTQTNPLAKTQAYPTPIIPLPCIKNFLPEEELQYFYKPTSFYLLLDPLNRCI